MIKIDLLPNEDDHLRATALNLIICRTSNTLQISNPLFNKTPVFYLIKDQTLMLSDQWHDFEISEKSQSYIYDYLKYQTPLTAATLKEDVSCLRNGESIEIDLQNSLVSSKFTYIGLSSDELKSSKDIRHRLEEQVLKLDRPQTVFHLSAGLDSSLLVLLANRLWSQNRPMAATCRTLGRGSTQELEFVHRLCDEHALDLQVFDFTDIDIFEEGRLFLKSGPGYPVAHPSHLLRYLLDKSLVDKGFQHIVTGRGADEALGGYSWHKPSFADPQKHHQAVRVTAPDTLSALFTTTDVGCAEENYWHFFHSSHELAERQKYDFLTLFSYWNLIDHALSRSFGVNYHNPFCDPAFIQQSFNLPIQQKMNSDVQKLFLRDTFSDLYPGYILSQPKRGMTFDMGAYLARYSHTEIMEKIFHSTGFWVKSLKKTTLSQMIEDTLNGTQNFGWQIWSIYLCSVAMTSHTQNN